MNWAGAQSSSGTEETLAYLSGRVQDETVREGDWGSVGGVDMKCGALSETNEGDCHGTVRRGAMDRGKSR